MTMLKRRIRNDNVELYRLDMPLVGANPEPRVRPEGELPGYVNYYLPHCPDGITGVKEYSRIVYQNADADAAADLADRARDLPEIAPAETAELVYRELPFAVPMNGGLVAGRIDLAYRQDGAWTVIDFKTSHHSDAARALAQHGEQLAAYRQALGRITGAPVRAALCLIRSGQARGCGATSSERGRQQGGLTDSIQRVCTLSLLDDLLPPTLGAESGAPEALALPANTALLGRAS